MESRFVERQVMHGGPKVEHIALSAAIGVEALEEILAEVGREGALRVIGSAMKGTAAAALQTAAAKLVEQSQVVESLLHGDLLAQESEVDPGMLGSWRRLDRRRRRRYRSIGRGDHFFCGQIPFVAHGLFVGRNRFGFGRG